MDKVKLGFVGCGFMGQMAHLSNFIESEKCEVVALAEKRKSLRDKIAQKYHISKTYLTHQELAQDKEIDAVVEITPDALHSSIAIDLMNRGKHVFTEKPMATNLIDATKMVEASEKNRVKLVIGYMKRYDPGVEKAKEIIDHFEKTKEVHFAESTKVVLFDMEGIATTLETGHISANFWDEELKVYYEDGWVELIASPPLLKNVPAKVKIYKVGKIQEVIEPYTEWDWSFK